MIESTPRPCLGLAQVIRISHESYETLRLLVDGTTNAEHSLIMASTTPPMYTDIDKGLPTYPALWSRIRTDNLGNIVNYYGTVIDLTLTPLAVSEYVGIAKSIATLFSIGWSLPSAWPAIAAYASEAAQLASSNKVTMTFSAPRVFVKVIVDMLNAVREIGEIPDVYEDMLRAFGYADRSLVESEFSVE